MKTFSKDVFPQAPSPSKTILRWTVERAEEPQRGIFVDRFLGVVVMRVEMGRILDLGFGFVFAMESRIGREE